MKPVVFIDNVVKVGCFDKRVDFRFVFT